MQSTSTPVVTVGGDITKMDSSQLAVTFSEAAKLLADFEVFSEDARYYVENANNAGNSTHLFKDTIKTGKVGGDNLHESIANLTSAQKTKYTIMIWTGAILCITMVGIIVGLPLVLYSVHGIHKTAKENLDAEIDRVSPLLENALNACEQSAALMSIPPAYRYSFAMEQMLQLVLNRRANTWVECADKYEELVHRIRLEQTAEEALELNAISAYYSSQAASSARAAAIFGGIMVAF